MLITYSVLSLALFVVIELQVADPLLDIRIFRHRAFTYTLLLIAVLMVVMFGVLFYIPLFLQQAQGLGAFDAGLTLLPQALVMGFLMPVAGRIYDRIGPRWPAAIGLTIVAIGTYLLHTLTLDTPRADVMWLLVLQGAGLGMAMMPIFTGGIAVIPMNQVNAASAFNNVVQRVSGAFGLAVLTAILTTQQAQQMAGRAALMPANTPVPNLGPTAPPVAGLYATYRMTQLQVFVGAIDDLFLIASALSALAAVGALVLLRPGPTPATPAGFAPPKQAPASPASLNGDATVQRPLVGSANANSAPRDPARQPSSRPA
jgi:MFS family permease